MNYYQSTITYSPVAAIPVVILTVYITCFLVLIDRLKFVVMQRPIEVLLYCIAAPLSKILKFSQINVFGTSLKLSHHILKVSVLRCSISSRRHFPLLLKFVTTTLSSMFISPIFTCTHWFSLMISSSLVGSLTNSV